MQGGNVSHVSRVSFSLCSFLWLFVGLLAGLHKNYRTDLYETFDTYSGFLFQFLYATICNNLHVSITIIIYLHILLLLAMCAQTVMGREQFDLPVSVQAVLFNAAGC